MEQGGHLRATLLRPPARRASVVRPPLRKAGPLVGAALAAASALRMPWALVACAHLLRAAGRTAPLILFLGVVRQELRASGDLLGALAAAVADPAVWLPAIGLVAAAFVASALVEVLGWSLGLPALRDRIAARGGRDATRRTAAGGGGAAGRATAGGQVVEAAGGGAARVASGKLDAAEGVGAGRLVGGLQNATEGAGNDRVASGPAAGRGRAGAGAFAAGVGDALAGRFAALLQTGVVLLLLLAAWGAAALPLLAISLRIFIEARAAGTGAGLLAAAALALVSVLSMGTGLLLRLVADAAIARAGAFGDRPLVAIHEGAALVLRRPLTFLAALYLLTLSALLVGVLLAFPAALAPPGAASLWVRIPVEMATAAALGLLALTRLGVFVAAAIDERPPA